jgi:hypothetical protein
MEVDSSRIFHPEDNEMLSTPMIPTTGLPGDISPRNSVAVTDTPTTAAMKKQELKVLADGKVMKVQKLRQRRILSCVYCHSKKIKCSRIHPVCNNCEKLGIECKYFVNERVSRGGKKSARLTLISQNDLTDGNYTLSNLDSMSRSDSISSKLTSESSNGFVIKSEFSSSTDPMSISLLPTSKPNSIKDSNDLVGVNVSPQLKSSSTFKMRDHDQLMKEHVDMISKSNSPIPEMSLNYLNLNLFNQQNQQNNDSDNDLNDDNINDTSREKRNNKLSYSTPPNIPNSLLQTPIMNNLSNNITNIYFGTNYSNQPQVGQQNSQNQQQEQNPQNSQQQQQQQHHGHQDPLL